MQNYTMGVLSGIVTGITAALLYRRFYDIRLPDYLPSSAASALCPSLPPWSA